MQSSFFGLENRYASLSEAGDPLERLNAVIDWEIFRPILERIDIFLRTIGIARTKAGGGLDESERRESGDKVTPTDRIEREKRTAAKIATQCKNIRK